MGPIALVGFLSLVFLLTYSLKGRQKKGLIFLAFPFTYFLYVGSWHVKFIRYMVPLLPFLALASAWFLVKITEYKKNIGLMLIGFFGLISIVWTTAFFTIYTRESTRITASKWIYQNIPPGSKILGEHWDDGLPTKIKPNYPSQYQIEQLTIYEPDNQEKIKYYAEKLSQSDYLIINSRRLYGTLMNLPEKYPITSRYYHLLFNDQLGYQKMAEFTSYPSFFAIKIIDDSSEETFQVYEHPKIIIFKNTASLDKEKYLNIISSER